MKHYLIDDRFKKHVLQERMFVMEHNDKIYLGMQLKFFHRPQNIPVLCYMEQMRIAFKIFIQKSLHFLLVLVKRISIDRIQYMQSGDMRLTDLSN